MLFLTAVDQYNALCNKTINRGDRNKRDQQSELKSQSGYKIPQVKTNGLCYSRERRMYDVIAMAS